MFQEWAYAYVINTIFLWIDSFLSKKEILHDFFTSFDHT